MPSWLISLAMVCAGALLSFLAARYWFARARTLRETERIAEGHEKLVNRVIEVERQLSLVGQAVLPISTAFQAILIRELTHYHTPRMDELLVKLGPPVTLTEAEESELSDALEQRTKDMGDLITDSERDAAHILPYVMKRAKAEAAVLGDTPVAFKLVTVVAPEKGDQPTAQTAPAAPR